MPRITDGIQGLLYFFILSHNIPDRNILSDHESLQIIESIFIGTDSFPQSIEHPQQPNNVLGSHQKLVECRTSSFAHPLSVARILISFKVILCSRLRQFHRWRHPRRREGLQGPPHPLRPNSLLGRCQISGGIQTYHKTPPSPCCLPNPWRPA